MHILALLSAATGALALLAAFLVPGAAASALHADVGLLGLGVAGLALAAFTWRAARISAFLRIFSWIFGVEFVLTGLAYVATRAGLAPAVIAPPLSMPITLAFFGALIVVIDFIPVMRQITRLADPYFETSDRIDVPLGPFGRVRMRESALGFLLIVLLVVINQAQVGIGIRLSFFNRDWFDAIQNRNPDAFWSLLYTVFLFWALIYIASALIELFLQSALQISWRRWLTERFSNAWLSKGGIYRLGLAGAADNPDQRIADDVRAFINNTYDYSITLLQQISNLVSFSIILWSIPADFTLPGTSIVIPGLLFWVCVAYSVIGTWLTHIIGRKLVGLEFRRERFEADFRFSLARLREYGEQIALLRGEPAERHLLGGRFAALVKNFYEIVWRNLKLSTFTAFYGQISPILPYVIVAPYYFLQKVTLGQMTQTAGAFARVESALSFFVGRYRSLAVYKAEVDRLSSFEQALASAQALGSTPPRIERVASSDNDLHMRNLSLALPAGREIVRIDALTLRAGEATLVNGPSGSGKSTMFRAIAGIWPYGQGEIAIPANAGAETDIMLLPQRPYVASGALKAAASYPAVAGSYSDAQVREALTRARLEAFVDQLDIEDAWAQRLSGGEQQRLAVAHALLAKPRWLFLDEATSALDEKLEAEIYAMLARELPDTTIVSIGHRSTLAALHRHRIELQTDGAGPARPVEVSKAPV